MTLPELIAKYKFAVQHRSDDSNALIIPIGDLTTLLDAAEDAHLLSEQNAEMDLALLEYEKQPKSQDTQLTLVREALEAVIEECGPRKMSDSVGTLMNRVKLIKGKAREALAALAKRR